MSFSLRNLSVLAYANGFTLWLYKSSSDQQTQVSSTGFFDEAGDMLAAGDMVMVSALDGGRVLSILNDGASLRTASVV